MTNVDFRAAFRGLTGNDPFLWQTRLFEELLRGPMPQACGIPTGLGKTSVIAVWLVALALQQQGEPHQDALPRRLVYVVDRRTVVDQATEMAEQLRSRLSAGLTPAVRDVIDGLRRIAGDASLPLAISTLRGEFADNRQWQQDPAKAAIIVGTVDLIGSRLLFSGYGVSRKMRPFHAGLIGHDALIVHDEAHLSPAFGKITRAIQAFQQGTLRPLKVMELSATQRQLGRVFSLSSAEQKEPEVERRLEARKVLTFHPLPDGADPAAELVRHALRHEPSRSRVIVYVRTPSLAKKVAGALPKGRTVLLTGTIRGFERDLMTAPGPHLHDAPDEQVRRRAIFGGFRADPNRRPPDATEYLVATSAGEVGVDLDGDHMVSDFTTLDSMIQRLGRVNRLGRGVAMVDVVILPRTKEKAAGESDDDEGRRIAATTMALESLDLIDGGRNAAPQALGRMLNSLGADGAKACFSAEPRMVELTDILLDGWSMTQIDDVPGRPPVERWLHGVTAEPPSLYIAWRQEVAEMVEADELESGLKTLFAKHPILARERLRAPLRDDLVTELTRIAKRLHESKVLLLPALGDPEAATLTSLLKSGSQHRLREATIVLPPAAGGLDPQGMLDGSDRGLVRDVADTHLAESQKESGANALHELDRTRILLMQDPGTGGWSVRQLGVDGGTPLAVADGIRLTLAQAAAWLRQRLESVAETGRVVLRRDEESGQPTRLLLLLSAQQGLEAVEENPGAAASSQFLDDHLAQVHEAASRIAERVGLNGSAHTVNLAAAVRSAATWHDRGKNRDAWQADIGHPRTASDGWKPWAKSGQRGFVSHLSGRYRHEFGSLREAAADPLINEHPERDLILHLIAAHHGWARPHFEEAQWDLAEDVRFGENEALSASVMRRYARLQRRFGHWGLAWLEALLRAADYQASRGIEPAEEAAS